VEADAFHRGDSLDCAQTFDCIIRIAPRQTAKIARIAKIAEIEIHGVDLCNACVRQELLVFEILALFGNFGSYGNSSSC
jgi:hypothetical protein